MVRIILSFLMNTIDGLGTRVGARLESWYGRLLETSILRIEKKSVSNSLQEAKMLYPFLRDYRDDGGLHSSFQMLKLLQLLVLLRSLKPQTIIEFGTGLTSVAIAIYQRESGCVVTQVDESAEYALKAKKLSGIRSELLIYESQLELYESRIEISYRCEILKNFDLAIVVGPDLTFEGIKYRTAINPNVRNMLRAGYGPKNVLIDGRDNTALDLYRFGGYSLQNTSLRRIRLRTSKFSYWNVLGLAAT